MDVPSEDIHETAETVLRREENSGPRGEDEPAQPEECVSTVDPINQAAPAESTAEDPLDDGGWLCV